MAKIGIDAKQYMEIARAVLLPELIETIKNNLPKFEETTKIEVVQELFRATTIAALEDYASFLIERIVEDNNKKLYEDLVRLGVIKEETEQ